MSNEYRFLGQPHGKGGHRFYKRLHDGAIVIADNSGADPDHTEDGPIIPDCTRIAKFEESVSDTIVLPVRLDRQPDRDRMWVTVTCDDYIWMVENDHWDPKNFRIGETMTKVFKVAALCMVSMS